MNNLNKIILSTLYLTCIPLLCILPPLSPAAFEQSSGVQFLDGVARLQRLLPSFIYDYEYVVQDHNTQPGVGRMTDKVKHDFRIRYWGQMRIAGDRVDVSGRCHAGSRGTPLPEIKIRQVWDGKMLFSNKTADYEGVACPEAQIAEGTSMSLALRSLDYIGGFLDGRLNGLMGLDWIEFARNASDLQIASQLETITGVACRRVSFRRGRISGVVWVDEQHGGHLRQAEMIVREIPESRLRRLLPEREPALVSTVYRVQDVEIEQVAGYFFPVSGNLISRYQYSNGKEVLSLGHVRRTKLTLNPDFAMMNAFRPDWADGTIVDNAQMTLKYRWTNGVLVPFADPALEAEARQVLRQVHDTPKKDLPSWLRAGEIGGGSRDNASKPIQTSGTATVDPCYDPVGPRDGLYCLYAVLRLSGKETQLADLLRPEYLSSFEGSAPSELVGAARRQGLFALSLNGLTCHALRHMQHPALLRVKGKSYSKKSDAWELFLGLRDGAAWLYSPLHGLRQESFSTLATRWNGEAVLLSRQPVRRLPVMLPDFLLYAALALPTLIVLLVLRRIFKGWGSAGQALGRLTFLRRSFAEGVVFCGLALGLGCLWHGIAANGLLASGGRRDIVQLSRKGNFLPRVTISQVRQIAAGREKAILIDARDSFSYLMGHIATARNVPIQLPDRGRQDLMRDVPRDARIVVYCGSESCAIAENMSARLAADGFTNLSVYKGGWQEWNEQGGKQS